MASSTFENEELVRLMSLEDALLCELKHLEEKQKLIVQKYKAGGVGGDMEAVPEPVDGRIKKDS